MGDRRSRVAFHRVAGYSTQRLLVAVALAVVLSLGAWTLLADDGPAAGTQVATGAAEPVPPAPAAPFRYSDLSDPVLFRVDSANPVVPTADRPAGDDDTPILISRQSALAAARRGTLDIELPDGTRYPVSYERSESAPGGNWTFIGRVDTTVGDLAAVLTFGRDGVFGLLPTPDGTMMEITTRAGRAFLRPAGGIVPPGPWAYTEGVYADFARDLPQGEEAILLSIKKRQRAEVRRAQGFGLDYSGGKDAGHLATHFGIYAASVRNLGSPVFPPRLFKAMAAEFAGDADVLTVSRDGRPLASVFSFYFRNTVFPYWGGGTEESRQWRASEAMYYELMCRASRRGCARFDFGRSKVGTGAYAFKKNWGFEPRPLTYAVRTADGSKPRQINPMNPKYRLQVAAWKRLPLPIANRLGPLIARGLG